MRRSRMIPSLMSTTFGLYAVFAAGAALAQDAASSAPLAPSVRPARAAALTVGGQVRWRLEGRDPAGYASAAALAGDSMVNVLRTRFHLAADFGNGLKTFVEGQDSREWGEETSVAADMAGLDLKQGYVELADWLGRSGLSLRVGRQTLNYGSARLVSELDWHKVGRSWDGFLVRHDLGEYKLDGFATVVKQGASAGNDNYFSGLVWHKGGMAAGREFYFFHQKNTDGSGKREKTAAGKDVGTELDLHAKTAVREHLKLWLGYSVFVPGDFVENTTGKDPRMDWFFVHATIDF